MALKSIMFVQYQNMGKLNHLCLLRKEDSGDTPLSDDINIVGDTP